MSEEDKAEMQRSEQLLTTVEKDLDATIEKLKKDNPCVDYRPDATLIPLRVAYLETLIKDLITNCQFPLDAVLRVYF